MDFNFRVIDCVNAVCSKYQYYNVTENVVLCTLSCLSNISDFHCTFVGKVRTNTDEYCNSCQ